MPQNCSHLESPFSHFGMWKACRWVFCAVLLTCGFTTAESLAQNSSFQPLQRTIKVLSTKLNGFGIPFKVDGKDGQFIEVQLYMSRDRGRNWSFHSRQPTTAKEFPFTAEGDGEYWFAIKTLDRNRRLMPDGDVRAELKIVVDTKKPKLGFQIESDPAGRVVCRWQASDDGLNVGSFKIEYRNSSGDVVPGQAIDETWKSIPVQLQQQAKDSNWGDQLAWWPDTTQRQLEVRIQIADFAGNTTTVNRYVAVQGAAWKRSSSGSTVGMSQQQRLNSFAQREQANSNAIAGAANSSNWQPRIKPVAPDAAKVAQKPVVKHSPAVATQGNSDRWRINGNPDSITARPASSPVQIGEMDYMAPPVPLDWDEPNPIVVSDAPPVKRNGSVTWESEVQSEESAEREFVGSTMGPSPQISPTQDPSFPRATDSIPSNPATMVRTGKQVIGESTTSWPDNQWNGPTEPKVNPQVALAPKTRPQPLADQPNRMVPIGRPKTDIATSPNQNRAQSGFSNAAFRKQEAESVVESVPQRVAKPATMPDSANTQIISTKRFQLNYDINAIDPSGVGQVDLWMTRDRGQTWKLWGQDPDNVSPFPVEVSEEGIYGFRIVVRSRDGLAGRGPTRGEAADMWVQVDVTAPMVRITSVPYGRGTEVGQLVINYAVSDANLTLRPNTVAWSTNPDGPWTTIEEDLRNAGRLLWKPARNVPSRIFLRLESIDRAGNVGAHNLEQAIDISGLIPRGTIFGVTPVGQ